MVGVALLTMVVVSACGGDDAGGDAAPGNDGGDPAITVPASVGDVPGLSAECEASADLSLAMSSTLAGGLAAMPDDLVDRLPADARDDGRVIVEAPATVRGPARGRRHRLVARYRESRPQIETYTAISGEVFDSEVEDSFDRLATAVAAECEIGS